MDTTTIESYLPAGVALVRAMPNLPLVAGRGMTALARGRGADDAAMRAASTSYLRRITGYNPFVLAAGCCGLALLVGVVVNVRNAFPGWIALLPLSAAAVLVLVGDERTDAQVFEVPVAQLSAPWQRAAQGLDTLLKPGEYRPITFDDSAAASRDDLVHVHLGHGLAQKSARVLRTALFSSAAEVNRLEKDGADLVGMTEPAIPLR